LPEKFRALCEGLVIQVDDFPTDEVLDALNAQTEFDLLGLFQGVGLPFQSESAPTRMPNMVWLYRRPILDYWAENDETLGAIRAPVVGHEIGPHSGLSDDDRARSEAGADAETPSEPKAWAPRAGRRQGRMGQAHGFMGLGALKKSPRRNNPTATSGA